MQILVNFNLAEKEISPKAEIYSHAPEHTPEYTNYNDQ